MPTLPDLTFATKTQRRSQLAQMDRVRVLIELSWVRGTPAGTGPKSPSSTYTVTGNASQSRPLNIRPGPATRAGPPPHCQDEDPGRSEWLLVTGPPSQPTATVGLSLGLQSQWQ